MFDKLEDLIHHYEELMNLLSEPDVANDANRFKKLMKEQSDLAPIVETYKEYKNCKQNIEDSLAILDEESDEEMRELAKEELKESKEQVEELEQKLKILLLPKDRRLYENRMISFLPVSDYLTGIWPEPLLPEYLQEPAEGTATAISSQICFFSYDCLSGLY